MATAQEILQQLNPAVVGALFPQQDITLEQIAQEIARQELLGGVEAIPRNVFGRPTQDALLHQMNIANMLLQAGEIDEARQRVESILPFMQGRTLTPQMRGALQDFALALASTREVPLENVLQLVPGRAPGTYTIQSALQDYAWRSALRGLTGIGIDPMTGQPGVLPQIMQWLSLAGTSLPGVLTSPVATDAQFPTVRWIMQLLLDLLNIGGENNEDNNQ